MCVPFLTPLRTGLIALTWLVIISALHVGNLYGLRDYENQLRVDLNVTIHPEYTDTLSLPIFEATQVSFEARRALITRLWSTWILAAWVPVLVLLAAFIAVNQRKGEVGPAETSG